VDFCNYNAISEKLCLRVLEFFHLIHAFDYLFISFSFLFLFLLHNSLKLVEILLILVSQMILTMKVRIIDFRLIKKSSHFFLISVFISTQMLRSITLTINGFALCSSSKVIYQKKKKLFFFLRMRRSKQRS
jgi:hypothetical protein